MMRSAPHFFASSMRGMSRPMPDTKILAAPACFEAQVHASPCWPGPWISTKSPILTPPRLSAHWKPLAMTEPMRAAASADRSSLILVISTSGAR